MTNFTSILTSYATIRVVASTQRLQGVGSNIQSCQSYLHNLHVQLGGIELEWEGGEGRGEMMAAEVFASILLSTESHAFTLIILQLQLVPEGWHTV